MGCSTPPVIDTNCDNLTPPDSSGSATTLDSLTPVESEHVFAPLEDGRWEIAFGDKHVHGWGRPRDHRWRLLGMDLIYIAIRNEGQPIGPEVIGEMPTEPLDETAPCRNDQKGTSCRPARGRYEGDPAIDETAFRNYRGRTRTN